MNLSFDFGANQVWEFEIYYRLKIHFLMTNPSYILYCPFLFFDTGTAKVQYNIIPDGALGELIYTDGEAPDIFYNSNSAFYPMEFRRQVVGDSIVNIQLKGQLTTTDSGGSFMLKHKFRALNTGSTAEIIELKSSAPVGAKGFMMFKRII